jgi:hypothetical protein
MNEIEKFLKEQNEIQFIAVSNISPYKLNKLFDIGIAGLPCPSVQIKSIPNKEYKLKDISEKDSLLDFGSISFVFNQKNIFGKHKTIPKNDATHQIYTGDAYTFVFPNIIYSSHIKAQNSFTNRLRDQYTTENCYVEDDFDIILRRKNKNKYELQEKFNKSLCAKLLFLKEADLLNEMKVFRTREMNNNGSAKKVNRQKTEMLLRRLIKKAEKTMHQTFETFISYEINQFLHSPKIEDTKKEANLENITAYMKKYRGAAQEQTNMGRLGKVSARNKYQLRSVQNMKDKIKEILTPEQYKEQEENRTLKQNELSTILNIRTHSEDFYDLIDTLSYNDKDENIFKAFEKWGEKKPTEYMITKIKEFVHINKNTDHLYFEAKPNKSFYFNKEYALDDEIINYVVVPNNLDTELLKKLEKTDLSIVTYNHKKPETRLKALYKCRGEFIKEEVKLSNKDKNKNKHKI